MTVTERSRVRILASNQPDSRISRGGTADITSYNLHTPQCTFLFSCSQTKAHPVPSKILWRVLWLPQTRLGLQDNKMKINKMVQLKRRYSLCNAALYPARTRVICSFDILLDSSSNSGYPCWVRISRACFFASSEVCSSTFIKIV